MASRTTIYCSDDTENMLRTLLQTVKDDPAAWSSQTGKPAPTNTSQLFSLLIEIGYDLVIGSQPVTMLGEPKPIWKTGAESGAGPPLDLGAAVDSHLYDTPIDAEHYRSLLKDESLRRGTSVETLLHEWDAQKAAKLPPLEADPLWQMIGIGRSGLGDVSENVDKYLVEDRIARMGASEES